jgi:hypothetical protein
MAPSGATTTPCINLASGSGNANETEVQVVKEVEPLKVVVQGHPLVL